MTPAPARRFGYLAPETWGWYRCPDLTVPPTPSYLPAVVFDRLTGYLSGWETGCREYGTREAAIGAYNLAKGDER